MDTHVHCFGSSWLYAVVDYSERCAVVGYDDCFRLFVAHLCEELAHWNGFSSVDVEGSKLRFGCTGHDCFQDFGDVEHCSIVAGVFFRYDASLCTASTMSLFLYVRIAFGLVAT